jgi:hypothetical protein
MSNKGYCVNADIAAYLGRTLTTAQQSEADTIIGAVETYIDRETRRAWILPPITGERYDLISPTLYLRHRPITSVQSIITRTQALGDTLYTAIAGVDYEVFDLALAQINFSSGYSGPRAIALVSYTPNVPVPSDISLCATLIAANTMTTTLLPDSFGLQKVQFGRETSLQFTDGVTLTVPPQAQAILDGYRYPIL